MYSPLIDILFGDFIISKKIHLWNFYFYRTHVNLEIAEEILSTTQAHIETAENGKEAIERIQQSKENYYSMIFMDVRMPIMNGYEAVEIIRNLERQDVKTVPIIAMTADAFAEDVKKAKDVGMNEHIAKPIDINRLYEIMRQYSNTL